MRVVAVAMLSGLGLICFGVGCDKGAGPSGPATKATAPVIADEGPLPEGMQGVLAGYERVRVRLAADDYTGVPGSAARFAEAAKKLAEATVDTEETVAAVQSDPTEAQRAALGQVAAVAERLARTSDMEPTDQARMGKTQRDLFGQLSQPLIGLLQTTPSLRKNLHMFECPMVDGYGRWVQPAEEISNPYMGLSMLKCGSARSFGAD